MFLNMYKDGDGKQTLSPTRKQPVPPTKTLVDGKEIEFQNADIEMPNELLPFQKARNRAARRVIAARNRKRA